MPGRETNQLTSFMHLYKDPAAYKVTAYFSKKLCQDLMVYQMSFQVKAIFQKVFNNTHICHRGKQTEKSQACQRGTSRTHVCVLF